LYAAGETYYIAEGVGPFQALDLDLSDGNGTPHLGPYILAGVNGSGKSTVLRTIAWVLDTGRLGFQYDDWMEMLEGHPESRALLVVAPNGTSPHVLACSKTSHALFSLSFESDSEPLYC
jgi:ABC-type hemin transport system ATPase subunit